MKLTQIPSPDGKQLTLAVEGCIDTVTAPELERCLGDACAGVESLTLDFSAVEYVSSAGLRVIMAVSQQMETQGSMVLANVSEDVMEVFEMTGFSEFLTFV